MRCSYIIAFICLAAQGCKKRTVSSIVSTHADVYVAGVQVNPNSGFGIEFWKNGVATPLGDSNYLSAECQGMTVSGGDVYISAVVSPDTISGDQISEFWKNGVVKILPHGSGISNIAVSDGNVYFAGSDSAGAAQYWINDSVVRLQSDGTGNSVNACCIFVSGQTVYVGGNEVFPNIGSHPEYWLNSNPSTLPTPTGSDCFVRAIFVLNSDVYLCGFDNFQAAYWTNAGETLLASATTGSQATSIFVSGEDIYIGGIDGNFAVYWKNGKEVDLTNGVNVARVNSIFVSGNDVYAAGIDGSRAVYWKNGNRIALALSDSTQVCAASAIIVQ